MNRNTKAQNAHSHRQPYRTVGVSGRLSLIISLLFNSDGTVDQGENGANNYHAVDNMAAAISSNKGIIAVDDFIKWVLAENK